VVVRGPTQRASGARRLRGAAPPGLTAAEQRQRAQNLARLEAYAAAGVFPAADTADGRLPTFIDDGGRRCAVAFLVEQSGGADVAARVGRRFRNAYVAAIDDPAFEAWVARSGLTRAELALIQPTYHYHDTPRSQLSSALRLEYLQAVAGARPDGLESMLGAEAVVRAMPGLTITRPAALAVTLEGGAARLPAGRAFYSADAQLGPAVALSRSQLLGGGLGLGTDGITGGVVPAALTVPVTAYWSVDLEVDSMNKLWIDRRGVRVQLRGRAEAALLGRVNEWAWEGATDLVWFYRRWNAPEIDVSLTASARHFAGTTYAGAALGFGFGTTYRWPKDDGFYDDD
jgi:hypothetical protein